MLMAGTYLLRENPSPTEEEVRRGIKGNICRCTGYVNIVQSIMDVADGHGLEQSEGKVGEEQR